MGEQPTYKEFARFILATWRTTHEAKQDLLTNELRKAHEHGATAEREAIHTIVARFTNSSSAVAAGVAQQILEAIRSRSEESGNG